MKKGLLIIFILCNFCSCDSKVNLIPQDHIRSVKISLRDLRTGQVLKSYYMQDKEKIKKLVHSLNDSERELWIFRPEYNIIITYQNQSEKTISCNANHIKIDGLTYKISSTITEILK